MTNQDPLKARWSFASSRRKPAPLDFEEIERIHKEWERYDLDKARRYWENRDMAGRYKAVPNDPKGPMLKHGCTLTMRSSGDKD